MPTFERDKRPYGLDAGTIDFANRSIDFLRSRKVGTIPLAEANGFRLSNRIRIFVQSHVRRCLAFVDGGLAEYGAGRPIVTDQCSRAIYENVAALNDFFEKLTPLVLENDHEKIDDNLQQAAFGTRVTSWLADPDARKSINILTQINKFVKEMPLRGEAYERLCDIVHPNGLGAMVYFVKIEDDVSTIYDAGIDPEKAYANLVLACALFLYVEHGIQRLDLLPPALTRRYSR
jgi:hypothetical protein